MQIALLQCTSAYPCQPRDTALRVMDMMGMPASAFWKVTFRLR